MLAATLLRTEMETPRSLFFFLNGLLINTDRSLPVGLLDPLTANCFSLEKVSETFQPQVNSGKALFTPAHVNINVDFI